MTEARKSHLRDVMNLAWGLYRADHSRGFADALAGAWRWTKGRAARVASAPSWAKGDRTMTLQLRSMLQSPIRRSLTGPYRESRGRSAGYVTSVMGR